MLKDANLKVADKALKYSDDRFLKVVRPVLKKAGVIATDEDIIKFRDAEKVKRFGKPKAEPKKEAPKAEPKKPTAKKKTEKKEAPKE
jgi:hypothetical protein